MLHIAWIQVQRSIGPHSILEAWVETLYALVLSSMLKESFFRRLCSVQHWLCASCRYAMRLSSSAKVGARIFQLRAEISPLFQHSNIDEMASLKAVISSWPPTPILIHSIALLTPSRFSLTTFITAAF